MSLQNEKISSHRYRLRFSKSPFESYDKGFLSGQYSLRNFFIKTLPVAQISKRGKFSFGPALPRGYYSECEYVDVWLEKNISIRELNSILSSPPEGFRFMKAESIPNFFPSITSLDNVDEYEIELETIDERFKKKFIENLKTVSLKVSFSREEGVNETVDIIKWIEKAYIDFDIFRIFVKRVNGKTLRPEIILKGLIGEEPKIKRVLKKNIYWKDSSGGLNPV